MEDFKRLLFGETSLNQVLSFFSVCRAAMTSLDELDIDVQYLFLSTFLIFGGVAHVCCWTHPISGLLYATLVYKEVLDETSPS